jgi:putative beta-lysine N-acetyltransferase
MDVMTKIGSSTVHHGTHNNRAYIVSFAESDGESVVRSVENLADTKGYTKIIAKVPESKLGLFQDNNYLTEGSLKSHRGKKYFFVSKYKDKARKEVDDLKRIREVIRASEDADEKETNGRHQIRRLEINDISEQIKIYEQVFMSYPFPIYDADFIRQTMDDGVYYYGVFEGGKLTATASADTDADTKMAEMTDFATLPQFRGKGYAVNLLKTMEKDMLKLGIKTFFTIARSVSFGMNKTFARCGYTYSGTLFNNTNINGSIESMNIWYKNV